MYLTVKEACKYFKDTFNITMTRKKLIGMIDRDEVKALKIGNEIYVKQETIDTIEERLWR